MQMVHWSQMTPDKRKKCERRQGVVAVSSDLPSAPSEALHAAMQHECWALATARKNA